MIEKFQENTHRAVMSGQLIVSVAARGWRNDRYAEGQLVVVQAGRLVISTAGQILKVTPDVTPDSAAIICPALGGQPAI